MAPQTSSLLRVPMLLDRTASRVCWLKHGCKSKKSFLRLCALASNTRTISTFKCIQRLVCDAHWLLVVMVKTGTCAAKWHCEGQIKEVLHSNCCLICPELYQMKNIHNFGVLVFSHFPAPYSRLCTHQAVTKCHIIEKWPYINVRSKRKVLVWLIESIFFRI